MSESAAIPRALFRRRDAPGLIHLVVQLALFASSATAAAALHAAGEPGWWIASSACGLAVLTFFPTLHEAGHQTGFARPGLNEFAVWLGALFMLQAPSFFREFHWEHHRSTQDPDKDPEISGAPSVLDDWPRNPLSYLALVSGQLLMAGKLGFTLACALLPASLWGRLFPFVRPERRAQVARQSRIAALILIGATWAGLRFVPGFVAVLWAWPIAHLLLGFYLMPEHTGLPNSGSQLERTRTLRSNALVRWLMWNMPYHAEHHLNPGVPFHALPGLHARLASELPHVASGYLAFHAEAALRALRVR